MPQMVNFETLGAIDFQKGCYPGPGDRGARAVSRPGEAPHGRQRPRHAISSRARQFNGGVVVDSAAGEALAVMPV